MEEAMEEILLNCEFREKEKKSILKNNRKSGKIPAVLYGQEKNELLYLNTKDFYKLMKAGAGENAIFNLVIGDKKKSVMIKERQMNPLTDKIMHLDFMEISMKKLIEVDVPIKTEGVAKGVTEGGILEYIVRNITIKCFPTDIPKYIPIDITNLGIGKGLHVKDLKLSEKIEVLTPPDQLLVNIVLPKEEAEKPAEAVATEAGAAEPEVIKKGKKEEGEEAIAEGAKPKEEKAKAEDTTAKDKKK